MLIVPIVTEGHQRDMLLVILGPDNIERMKQADPVQFNFRDFGASKNLVNPIVGIFYEEDPTDFKRLVACNDMQGALKYLTRGFKFRPERGDHDDGPKLIASGGNDASTGN